MKIAPTFLIICFLSMGIFLIGTGCEQKPPSPEQKPPPPDPKPSPEQRWESQVRQWKNGGYNVLDIGATERWLVDNPTITIDNGWFRDLGFLDQKSVKDGFIMTKDHNGNLRLVVFGEPPPPPPDPGSDWLTKAGFMSAEESAKWLRKNGYQVKQDSNGYTIIYDFMRGYVRYKGSPSVSKGSTLIPGLRIPDGYVNIDETGIRVKVTNTQQ